MPRRRSQGSTTFSYGDASPPPREQHRYVQELLIASELVVMHDDGGRIPGAQVLEARLVQALPLVLDALVSHSDARQILGREELGSDARAGRPIWVRLDGLVT